MPTYVTGTHHPNLVLDSIVTAYCMLISSSTAVHTRKLSRSRSSSSSSQSREAASPTRCSLTKRSARKDLNGGRDEATALLAPCSRTQDSTLRGEYRYALMTHESYAQQQDGYTAVRACQVLTSSKSNPQPIELTAATYCRAAGRVCQSTAVAYYWREGNSKKKEVEPNLTLSGNIVTYRQ